MQDFPPEVPAYPTSSAAAEASGSRGRDRSFPDTRSPARFLIWLLGRQKDVLLAVFAAGILVFLPGALGPYLVGRAVDEGITAGSMSGLLTWSLILLGVIAVGAGVGVAMHTFAVRGRSEERRVGKEWRAGGPR